MSTDTRNTDYARKLLKSLRAQIPGGIGEVEKQIFIGKKLMPRISQEDKSALRGYFRQIMLQIRQYDVSDIELGGFGSNSIIWVRIQGRIKASKEFGVFHPDEFSILIQSLLMESQKEKLYTNRSLDLSYSTRAGEDLLRYRANIYFELGGLSLSMRAINPQIRPYASYNFHPSLDQLLSLKFSKEGLVLITGISGAGKSTTLDAIIDMNNRTVDGHIVLIASPVEFIHPSKRCVVRHREVGVDTMSFKTGAIEALRQDPDIIVIGEMRDPETILATLEAADSGHKVFSTLHTSSAIESVERIVGEVPSDEQNRVRQRLADTLRCVISQKLVPSLDGRRVLAREIMIVTPSVRSAIKNNNANEIYQMINEGNRDGMVTMEQDLKRLYLERRISREDVYNYANNKRRVQQLLQ